MLDTILIFPVLIIVVLASMMIYLKICETGRSVLVSTERDQLANILEQALTTISGLRTSVRELRAELMIAKCESISHLPYQECSKSETSKDLAENSE